MATPWDEESATKWEVLPAQTREVRAEDHPVTLFRLEDDAASSRASLQQERVGGTHRGGFPVAHQQVSVGDHGSRHRLEGEVGWAVDEIGDPFYDHDTRCSFRGGLAEQVRYLNLAYRRKLVTWLKPAETDRLLDLVEELAVNGNAGSGIEAEADRRALTHVYVF